MVTDKYQALKELRNIISEFQVCIKENKNGVPYYRIIDNDDLELDEDDIVINLK